MTILGPMYILEWSLDPLGLMTANERTLLFLSSFGGPSETVRTFFIPCWLGNRVPRPPNVPLLRALWSLLDAIWGVLKGSWGVLVEDPQCLFDRARRRIYCTVAWPGSESKLQMWVVIKIMVSSWVPQILGAVLH